MLLTNGYVKKTQKTPKQEIVLAKTYRADYYARKERKHRRKEKDLISQYIEYCKVLDLQVKKYGRDKKAIENKNILNIELV